MKLTRYTDYGFRLLTYLALLPDGRRASIDEISDVYGISRNNINKIVHQLSKAGVIETKKGKGGGFHLKMASEDINVGDMVLLLENSISLADCLSPPCKIASACVLKDVFDEAAQSFIDTLRNYTLNDLVKSKKNRQNLKGILKIQEG